MLLLTFLYSVLVTATVASASSEISESSNPEDLKLRLIGAKSVEEGEVPWIVSLQYDKLGNKTFKHSCAGSIVHKRYIVTAAHCTWNKTVERLHILAGTLNVKIRDDGQQRINVSKIIGHPLYKSTNRAGPFDIAVLKLESDLEFNENVKAIDLPEYGRKPSGQCTSFGWGNKFMITRIYYDASEELRKITSYVLNWNLCWLAYGPMSRRALQTALCTYGGPFKGSCQGDSGGPVICYKEDKSPYLAGVVSWGWIVCGDGLHPGSSVRVYGCGSCQRFHRQYHHISQR